MDRQPNHEDALLILRIFELRRDPRMREARDWFARSFNATNLEQYEKLCRPGTEENMFARMVTSYWDMVASFLTNGVLHEELFFQSGRELLLVWERVRALAPTLRKALHDPGMWSNLESAGKAFADWWQRTSPEGYRAFTARIHAMAAPKSKG
jgi:hypothetical protein